MSAREIALADRHALLQILQTLEALAELIHSAPVSVESLKSIEHVLDLRKREAQARRYDGSAVESSIPHSAPIDFLYVRDPNGDGVIAVPV